MLELTSIVASAAWLLVALIIYSYEKRLAKDKTLEPFAINAAVYILAQRGNIGAILKHGTYTKTKMPACLVRYADAGMTHHIEWFPASQLQPVDDAPLTIGSLSVALIVEDEI